MTAALTGGGRGARARGKNGGGGGRSGPGEGGAPWGSVGEVIRCSIGEAKGAGRGKSMRLGCTMSPMPAHPRHWPLLALLFAPGSAAAGDFVPPEVQFSLQHLKTEE